MRNVVGAAFLFTLLVCVPSRQIRAQEDYERFRMTLPWAGEVEVEAWMLKYSETHRTLEGIYDVASIPEDHSLVFRDLNVVHDAVFDRATVCKSTVILLHANSPEFLVSCRWETPQLSADPTLCLVQENPESESHPE